MKKIKQKKLGVIDGEVLIVGIDIAKRKHCAVAIKKMITLLFSHPLLHKSLAFLPVLCYHLS
jgi:hypothetical protein